MDKALFSKIAKKAHALTKEYRKKFADVDYRTQMGIFFKLLYRVAKSKIEKAVNAKQKTVNGIKEVTTYVKGNGLNINYYTTRRDYPPTNDILKWRSIWTLPIRVIFNLL